ncbi:MAG: 30S ribosomal protein S12 methylthiotransferase RimO [Candidatus Marinimicrobia bacterium]|nr:30S ribosomal protein S12 methylthiotransferase RimO [Candidatus Neomarinimicrobiota bacterium]
MKNINLISLGCAKNLVDSEILLGGLKKSNFNIVDNSKNADIVIVNTCGFLDSARDESVDVILEAGELRSKGEIKQLVVMGCFSERYDNDLKREIPEVDAFFGTSDHAKIISFLTGEEYVKSDPDYFRSLLTPKHYAYLKIAEGCDNGCSFCSIPLMRGLQISRSIEANVEEARRLGKQGVKEILVIGQDTTSYGWDLKPKATLHELMDELNKIDEIDWIRLHYAHPAHLHREMIVRFGKLEKLLPYIDMPIQHASTKLLKSMRRGLGKDGILKRIEALRNACPNIILRTSIIVGYPGETEEDFLELYDFIKKVRFDRLGVFTYSEEEGTFAEKQLIDNVPQQVKYDRMDKIMTIQQEISYENNQQLIGTTQKIIIDQHLDSNESIGRSFRDSPEVDNIFRIDGLHPVGEFINAKVISASEYEIICTKD